MPRLCFATCVAGQRSKTPRVVNYTHCLTQSGKINLVTSAPRFSAKSSMVCPLAFATRCGRLILQVARELQRPHAHYSAGCSFPVIKTINTKSKARKHNTQAAAPSPKPLVLSASAGASLAQLIAAQLATPHYAACSTIP